MTNIDYPEDDVDTMPREWGVLIGSLAGSVVGAIVIGVGVVIYLFTAIG